MLDNLLLGFQTALAPFNLAMIVAGTALGIFVGALPGLSASSGLAIVLPVTFGMDPIPGMLMMIALYMAAQYGGSITAIAVGVPGDPPSFATTLDGYPLAKKGQAGKALGMSVIASACGGVFGVVVLIFAAAPLASFGLRFGPAEYFALAVFGLSIVSNLGSGGLLRSSVSVLIGLLCGVVGTDVLSGYPRFTFGNANLLENVKLPTALIGLFAISEVFRLVEESGGFEPVAQQIAAKLPSREELKASLGTILRSSIIGTAVGVVPGAGATIASLIAYNEAKRVSKHPEAFGTGVLEGVAAPEAAACASVGGATIPLITLGIPGSASTAVLLGGLILQGMEPGPLLMSKQPQLVYSIYSGYLIAIVVMFIIGLVGIPLWLKLISLRNSTLTPLILGISMVGAYAIGNNVFDMGIAVFFGILGYLMRTFEFPLPPTVLALVLGPILEVNYRRTMTISSGDPRVFFTHPISLVLLIVAFATFFTPAMRSGLARRAAQRQQVSGA